MTNQLTARQDGASIEVRPREVLRDGPMRVECWWSAEDDAWLARLTDDELTSRPFIASHIAHGDTREEALAHLAVSLFVTALAVADIARRAPAPQPEYPRDNAIARAIVQAWPDHRSRPTMHEALAFLQQLEAAGYDSAALAFVRGLGEAEAQGMSVEDFLGRAPFTAADYERLHAAAQRKLAQQERTS